MSSFGKYGIVFLLLVAAAAEVKGQEVTGQRNKEGRAPDKVEEKVKEQEEVSCNNRSSLVVPTYTSDSEDVDLQRGCPEKVVVLQCGGNLTLNLKAAKFDVQNHFRDYKCNYSIVSDDGVGEIKEVSFRRYSAPEVELSVQGFNISLNVDGIEAISRDGKMNFEVTASNQTDGSNYKSVPLVEGFLSAVSELEASQIYGVCIPAESQHPCFVFDECHEGRVACAKKATGVETHHDNSSTVPVTSAANPGTSTPTPVTSTPTPVTSTSIPLTSAAIPSTSSALVGSFFALAVAALV